MSDEELAHIVAREAAFPATQVDDKTLAPTDTPPKPPGSHQFCCTANCGLCSQSDCSGGDSSNDCKVFSSLTVSSTPHILSCFMSETSH